MARIHPRWHWLDGQGYAAEVERARDRNGFLVCFHREQVYEHAPLYGWGR